LERLYYDYFFNKKTTPMRCVMVSDAKTVKASCLGCSTWAASWVKRQQRSSTTKLFFNNGVKFFTDDAFVGLTMQVASPGYIDKHSGIWVCGKPGATYAANMLPWWKAGCRIHVHSNGDAAQDATAEVLATLQACWPRFDHRFCLEHYGMSALHLHRKLKNLGASVAVNVFYPYLRGELNIQHMGKDRAFAASRLRSIVDAGIPCAMHTDTPVAPPRPLQEMWIAVNRKTDAGVSFCESECITQYEALKMKTVDAAYIHGLDGLLGSIEAGKLADFTVLKKNPLTIQPDELRNIEVWGTVVGGVVYKAELQQNVVPLPPRGLFGPLLWLKGMTTKGEFAKGMWLWLAALSGCKGAAPS